MMNPQGTYIENYRLRQYDIDVQARMRLSWVMRHIQQMGESQLESQGIGYEKVLKNHNMVFLITKLALDIVRLPKAGEEIIIKTCPQTPVGVQFFRETHFEDLQGNHLLEANASWVLFDPVQRKILRPQAFPFTLANGQFTRDKSIFAIQPPAPQSTGQRQVHYSDVDINDHLTNSVYGDILYDFLPDAVARGPAPKQVVIHFQNEAKPNTCMDIHYAQQDNTHYIWGESNGKTNFLSKAVF